MEVGELKPGNLVQIMESIRLDDGTQRIRTTKGWVTSVTNAGQTVIRQTVKQMFLRGYMGIWHFMDAETEANFLAECEVDNPYGMTVVPPEPEVVMTARKRQDEHVSYLQRVAMEEERRMLEEKRKVRCRPIAREA